MSTQTQEEVQKNIASSGAIAALKAEVVAYRKAGERAKAVEAAEFVATAADMTEEQASAYVAWAASAPAAEDAPDAPDARVVQKDGVKAAVEAANLIILAARKRDDPEEDPATRTNAFRAWYAEIDALEKQGQVPRGTWFRHVRVAEMAAHFERVDTLVAAVEAASTEHEALKAAKAFRKYAARVGIRFMKAEDRVDEVMGTWQDRQVVAAMKLARAGEKTALKNLYAAVEAGWSPAQAKWLREQVRDARQGGLEGQVLAVIAEANATPEPVAAEPVASELEEKVAAIVAQVTTTADELAGMASATVMNLLDGFQVDLAKRAIAWVGEAFDLDLMEEGDVEEAIDAAEMVIESGLATPEPVVVPSAFVKKAQLFVDDIVRDGGYKTATAWAADFEAAWGVALVVALPPEVVAKKVIDAIMSGDEVVSIDDAAVRRLVASEFESIDGKFLGEIAGEYDRVDRILASLEGAGVDVAKPRGVHARLRAVLAKRAGGVA